MALPTESMVTEVDPVTFEVIRHRLLGIVDEQAARLSAISGSKNVTEMSDFNVGIYLPDGSVAVMGRTILFPCLLDGVDGPPHNRGLLR